MGLSVALPRAPAFLLSLLVRQWLLTKERFGQRYPHGWLVWEPGEWVGPARGEDISVAETRLPTNRPPDRPPKGDALCFELRAAEGAPLRLGRAEGNDIILNDMTVSREHLRLSVEGGRWVLSPGTEAKATMVSGSPLAPGASRPLKPGDVIKVGGLTLSFYDSERFIERVRSQASQTT